MGAVGRYRHALRPQDVECVINGPGSPEAMFHLLHSYDRRLAWNLFLREARVLDIEIARLCQTLDARVSRLTPHQGWFTLS